MLSVGKNARAGNEAMGQMIADHPGRFGAFALLPLPDVDAALAEIDYALDVLRLDGGGMFSNHEGDCLGDPAFERVFAKPAERDALVHVRPTAPSGKDQPTFGLPIALYEYPFDTTRMIASLVWGGTLARYPGLRLITSHAGGTVPCLAERLAVAGANFNPKLEVRDALRNPYYDVALSANPHTLAALSSFAPTEPHPLRDGLPVHARGEDAAAVLQLRTLAADSDLDAYLRFHAAREHQRLRLTPNQQQYGLSGSSRSSLDRTAPHPGRRCVICEKLTL
ncbi:amidohydrolase family protein [Streptantibioticus ferralitis]|uniref:6-methylsalicylate decarboxylase n=1 Tax=Streptantibioticus ferralitis TaxID=236510 RepID=A0ABT5Z147_9ACTN|nr:amidohydrolase family protein [Streptantibioticus ferralitis]MDF2257540.1 amidohydrolase family protein [Streptantibioticus ferralitis]